MSGRGALRCLGCFGLAFVLTMRNPYAAGAAPKGAEESAVSGTKEESYGIANVDTILNIREGPGSEYPVVGQMNVNALCHIHGVEGGWASVTSGNISGFVDVSYLYTGHMAEQMVENVGEENFPVADVYQEPLPVFSTSVYSGEQVVQYAMEFLGNPYVWGGTSLTEGTDCSGFVQSVYANFGISLPRVAEDQAYTGVQVDIGQLQPGDLVFYYDGETIYHVVIYVGEGQVVHASSSQTGIKVSDLYYEQAVWGVRLL
ncbi:MAG: NlpC/P60 family protein [Blautia sp.]|jgi:hypothetical protein